MAQALFSYNNTLALPCRGCGGSFRENDVNVVAFEKRRFHLGCFKCNACKKQLNGEEEAMPVRELPYCIDTCYKKAAQTLCGGCGEPITGPVLNCQQLHKKFHPECFKCAKCGKGIMQNFRVRNNEPLCVECSSKF